MRSRTSLVANPTLRVHFSLPPSHQSALLVTPLPLPKEEIFSPNLAALNHPPAAEAIMWRNIDMGNVDGDG